MDQAMEISKSSASASSSDHEVVVSIPRACHGHRHHRHHHRGHGHGHHRPHGEHIGECSHPANVLGEPPVSVILGDLRYPRGHNEHHHQRRRMDHQFCVHSRHGGRKSFKFMRRKDSEVRRGRRTRHLKQEMQYGALLRRCERRDQPGLSDSGALGVEDRHGFPSHLLQDWQEMDGLEPKSVECPYLQYVERGVPEVREGEWSPLVGVAEAVADAVAETFGVSSQLQTLFSRRPGRRGKHGHMNHRRCHHNHHHRLECPHQRHRISAADIDVNCQRVAERTHPVTRTRVAVGREAPAAVPVTQPRDEAGPSATFEEKLAEGLVVAPDNSS